MDERSEGVPNSFTYTPLPNYLREQIARDKIRAVEEATRKKVMEARTHLK
jgi:hypothetical protein